MEERPQVKTWLHQVQAARPDLSVTQIVELAHMQFENQNGGANGA